MSLKIDIDRVARLARLKLSAEERISIAGHLERILDYMAVLAEVDTTGVVPLYHPNSEFVRLREDVPAGAPGKSGEESRGLDREAALAGAPERSGDFFAVPKVIE